MRGPTAFGISLAWAVPLLAEAAALARSVAFARLIGAEELGQAMILALTVRLVEMASDVGLERLLVQAPDGECARLQAGLHGVAIARGLVAALFILALAPGLAILFEDGPTAMAHASLAAIPLIRGLVHLDFRRAERTYEYRPMAIVEGGATLVMMATILPAVLLFGDHRAMALVLIAHAAALTVLSHVIARRGYAVRLDPAILRRSWAFGAPLILNAVLMFLTFYADRVIVAHSYDWASVALYGVVLQLALLPAQIVGRAASSLVLPKLRQALVRDDLAAMWSRVLLSHCAFALAIGAGFAAFAPSAIALVYGDAFRPDIALALAAACAAAFRVLRTPASQLAIATGRTADPARANLLRALALVPACIFAAAGLPLAAIAAATALGEAAATVRAYQLSTKITGFHGLREVRA